MRTLYPIYGSVNQINTEDSKAGGSEASLLLKGKDFGFHLTNHLEYINVRSGFVLKTRHQAG